MQTAAVSTVTTSAAGDKALQSEIAALRESLKNHRARARKLWDACGATELEQQSGEARLALGQFTEKLLKGRSDAAFA